MLLGSPSNHVILISNLWKDHCGHRLTIQNLLQTIYKVQFQQLNRDLVLMRIDLPLEDIFKSLLNSYHFTYHFTYKSISGRKTPHAITTDFQPDLAVKGIYVLFSISIPVWYIPVTARQIQFARTDTAFNTDYEIVYYCTAFYFHLFLVC